LAERCAELVRDQPEERVGRAARREGDNEPDWPVRIAALRLCERNEAEQQANDRTPLNEAPHIVPPWTDRRAYSTTGAVGRRG